VLDHGRLTSIEGVRVEGDELLVVGRAAMEAGRPDVLRLDRVVIGSGTDLRGEVHLPRTPADPWVVRLSGRSLDASGEYGRKREPAPASASPAAEPPPGPPWRVEAKLDRVVLGAGREMLAVAGTADNDGRMLRSASLTGRIGKAAPFTVAIQPMAGGRLLSGSAADAGALLRVLGVVADMQGGKLQLSGRYDDTVPGHPLTGTVSIDDFRLRNAPTLGRLLQAMTLYGVVEVLQGPGLGFNRLVAPFRLQGDVLDLADARAYSASLGMTAKGRIDLTRNTVDLEGTIVPAYFFNSLLGGIPFVGRLFSPERGGGLFAATYGVKGSLDDPTISVNPLAALTPGFLRGLFGVFDASPPRSGAPSGK
jgi:hypothetical protein